MAAADASDNIEGFTTELTTHKTPLPTTPASRALSGQLAGHRAYGNLSPTSLLASSAIAFPLHTTEVFRTTHCFNTLPRV